MTGAQASACRDGSCPGYAGSTIIAENLKSRNRERDHAKEDRCKTQNAFYTGWGSAARAPVSDIGPDRARQGKFGPVAAAARPIGRGRRRHRSAGGRPMRAPCVSRTMILAPARHTINSNECCYHILCTAFRTGSGFWTAAPWFDKDSQVLRAIMGGISTAGGMCRADGNLCRCPSGTEFRHQFPAAASHLSLIHI